MTIKPVPGHLRRPASATGAATLASPSRAAGPASVVLATRPPTMATGRAAGSSFVVAGRARMPRRRAPVVMASRAFLRIGGAAASICRSVAATMPALVALTAPITSRI